METPETVNAPFKRQVWNAGRTICAKRALKPKQIWEIRFYLNQRRRLRDRALFDLAIDSKLRGCDLVQMKIGDIVSGGQIRTRAIVMQQKTGRPVQFELLPDARASLLAWLEQRGGTVDDYVFPSRVNHNVHLSTRQYAWLVDEWVTGVGLMQSEYGTHSLRRTKASIIYRATGNLRAVQILLGHSKIENTVRYLGIDVEELLPSPRIPRSEPLAPRYWRGANFDVAGTLPPFATAAVNDQFRIKPAIREASDINLGNTKLGSSAGGFWAPKAR
ncbi:hypothetical protein NSDW_19720 [Novosphingobium olei]|nr:hypothetical protein NSDW_19720 [Novosphingobium olei]